MISRRHALVGSLSLPVLAACQDAAGPRPVASAPPAAAPSVPPASDAMQLIYVSAWNCSVCPNFNSAQMEPYERSPEATRVPLRRVVVPRFSDIWTTGGYWPADLEWLRAQRQGGGTPYMILIRGNTVLERRFGWRAWTATVHPRILRELESA